MELLSPHYEAPAIIGSDANFNEPVPIDEFAMALPIVIAVAAGTWVVAVVRITRAVQASEPRTMGDLRVVVLPPAPDSAGVVTRPRQSDLLAVVTLTKLT